MSKDEKEKGKKKKEKKKKETEKKMAFLYATRAMPGHNDLWWKNGHKFTSAVGKRWDKKSVVNSDATSVSWIEDDEDQVSLKQVQPQCPEIMYNHGVLRSSVV